MSRPNKRAIYEAQIRDYLDRAIHDSSPINVEHVASVIGISRYTIYNLGLDQMVRDAKAAQEQVEKPITTLEYKDQQIERLKEQIALLTAHCVALRAYVSGTIIQARSYQIDPNSFFMTDFLPAKPKRGKA